MGTLMVYGIFHPNKIMFPKYWASPIQLYIVRNCLATERVSATQPWRKCPWKGRRRCIAEQWVCAVPSSIMSTPSRTGSKGSCQDTSFSFEVNSKGPAQDTRSEAHTGVGVPLLFCAQWDCRGGVMCVGVLCVHRYSSLTSTKPQSALKW